MTALFRPAFLAIAQLDDRVFLGVMLRGVAVDPSLPQATAARAIDDDAAEAG